MTDKEHIELQIPMPWGHIAACWYGDRCSRPLVAIHGWQDNAGTWAPLAPLIAPHRAVLAIDLPGHGRSSHLPPGIHYHTLDYVRVIYRIMLYYGWTKISLMGHSMGAALSFHFSALYPQYVDLFIAFDIAKTRYFDTNMQLTIAQYQIEKLLLEEERSLSVGTAMEREPPLYTFAQLEQLLHAGSDYSINLDSCAHILERSVTRSLEYPDKYYFIRDNRIKFLFEFNTEPALVLAMAQRIRNVHYMLLTGEHSTHVSADDEATLRVLRENNQHFEQHEVPGATHHLHLNDAEKVAEYVVPFLLKYPLENELREMQKSKL